MDFWWEDQDCFFLFQFEGRGGFSLLSTTTQKEKTHFFWFLSKFTFAGSRTEAENPKSRESAVSRNSFSLSTGKAVFPPDTSSSSLCSTKQIWAMQNNHVGFAVMAHIRSTVPLLAATSPWHCRDKAWARQGPAVTHPAHKGGGNCLLSSTDLP